MEGFYLLMAGLTHGAGPRLRECLHLRVKDLGFANGTSFVRSGKGDKDRTTFLPEILEDDLHTHLKSVRKLHDEDLRIGLGEAELPRALAR